MGLALLSSRKDTLVTPEGPSSGAGRSTTTGADGKSDDQRTDSTGRREGISHCGGEGIENPSIDGALEDGPLGYIIPSQVCGVRLSGTNNSDGTLEVVTRPASGAPGGFTVRPEGVENVSIVEVDGDGPFGGLRPKAGREGTAGEGVRLSVIVESRVWRMDPTTDSVCEGVEARQGDGDGTVHGRCIGSAIETEKGPEPRLNGMRGVDAGEWGPNWVVTGVKGEEESDRVGGMEGTMMGGHG
jgi:hypothetical protein